MEAATRPIGAVEQDRGELQVPWKSGDAVAATSMVFGAFVVLLLLAPATDAVYGGEAGSVVPWFAAVAEAAFLVAVWIFGVRRYRTGWRVAGLRSPRTPRSFLLPWLVVVASLGFASVYVAVLASLGLDSLWPSPVPEELVGHGVERLLNGAVVVGLGPFAEEIFFRGFLLTALVRPFGVLRAALLSSAVFALAHLSLNAMVPIFFTGLLLAWLYLKSRSIWPPVMAHAAQNLLAFALAA